MLPELLELSYTSPDDETTIITKNYEKRQLDAFRCEYRNVLTIDSPELPYDRINVRIVDPKASATFFGTRRAYFSFRDDLLKPTPSGVGYLPNVLKGECSLPVGLTALEAQHRIRLFNALIAHQIFYDAAVRGES